MLVECIANSTSLLSKWPKEATPIEELLKVGKIYDVFGLYLGDTITYEILVDELDSHTTEFPSFLFKVVDNRLSSFFVLGESGKRFSKNGGLKNFPFISFPEWANDINFFDRLFDGDKDAQEIFNKYKKLFYLEYRHVDIDTKAIFIQDDWVQCSVCTEAWELEIPNFEMCQCPQCSTVLLNPLPGSMNN
jgi:hypothetical protein